MLFHKEAASKSRDQATSAMNEMSTYIASEEALQKDAESQVQDKLRKAREEGAKLAMESAREDHHSAISSLREGHQEALSQIATSHKAQLHALQKSHVSSTATLHELEESLHQQHLHMWQKSEFSAKFMLKKLLKFCF